MDEATPENAPWSPGGHEDATQPAVRRPNPGWFRPGEPRAPGPGAPPGTGDVGRRVRHRGALPPGEAAEAEAALAERTSAIVADLGGDLSVIAAGLVERHARLELVADYLFENIERAGPLTGAGKTRACLTNWLLVVDRLERSARTLGIERRTKQVDLAQAFAQQERERS